VLQIMSSTSAALVKWESPGATAPAIIDVLLGVYCFKAIKNDCIGPIHYFAFSLMISAATGMVEAILGFICLFTCDDSGTGLDSFCFGLSYSSYKIYYSYIAWSFSKEIMQQKEGNVSRGSSFNLEEGVGSNSVE